ncbi:MAG: SMI1/KNR4 family protein [Oscillospiraceae bacterium]|nr:SMI1/KNR4 family protein [Oscillospiraceae bacterium]
MYNFFREDCDKYIPVSEDDINRVEKKLGIVFPDVLRKYYLEHNGKRIHTLYIPECDGEITGVHDIIPIITNEIIHGIKSEFSVECIKENELNEPWNRVASYLIPLAINEGGDIYYWDTNDGKVYISFNADEDENGMEIPYYVCSSVDEMFRLMNEAYEKKINSK